MASESHPKALEEAARLLGAETDTLRGIERLRRRFPPELVRRAAELVDARARAIGRLPGPARLNLTRKGVEQASSFRAAAARARTVRERLPGARVLDGTAGVGMDALALAAAGLSVVALDRDPLHAACARDNLRRYAGRAHALVADALRPPVREGAFDVLLLDPDRRSSGTRSLDPRRWSPPLDGALELAARFDGGCLKLAPALDPGRVEVAAPHAWRWTSVRGELAETTLWTGALAREAPEREVVALARGGRTRWFGGAAREVAPLSRDEALRVRWIADPDPALVRSGLLGAWSERAGLAPLGPRIAFLGGTSLPRFDGADGPPRLARLLRVVDGASVDRRRVREMLRRHDVGPLAVRKRGHPRSADELARELAGSGSRRGELVVCRLERGHHAWLVERVDAAGAPAEPA